MKTSNLTKTNHEGDTHVLPLLTRTRLTIRSTHAFNVEISDGDSSALSIIAPDNDTARYAQIELDANTDVHITTLGKLTLISIPLPHRGEQPDPESLCEIVPDKELSMYDRLKAEMFQALSVYAETKGLDTFEDDNDMDFEEEDNLITTPYEYQAMQDEQLANQPLPVAEPSPAPIGEESAAPIPESEAPTPSETAS